jgi:hypothetical protein
VRDRTDGVTGVEFAVTLPWVTPGGSGHQQLRHADRYAPVLPLAHTAINIGTESEAKVAPEPAAAVRLRIAIVDDAPLNRRIAERYARTLGHDSVLLSDGDEVAAAVAAAPVDVIMMDIRMARMDGDVACRTLRAGGYTGPIIAVRRAAHVV